MAFRISWLAGIAAVTMVIVRFHRLFLSSLEDPPWQLVLTAAALIAALLTWASWRAQLGGVLTLLVNLVALTVLAAIYIAPDTTLSGLPTADTIATAWEEIRLAVRIFRSGSPPVVPLEGVVVLASTGVWTVSALMVWGLTHGRPYLALLPAVMLYLQLATIDRRPGGLRWLVPMVAIVGLGLAAITADQQTSLTRRGLRRGAALPVLLVAALTAVTAGAAVALDDAVPARGVVDWRGGGGLGGGFYGSVSYNPFVDVRRGLVSQTDQVVFTATVNGDVDRSQIYWRLLTLDSFNGAHWYSSGGDLDNLVDDRWEDPEHEFRGDTARLTQDITIAALAQEWMPAVYSPRRVASDARVVRGARVADDASLYVDSLTYGGLNYQVVSEVPDPDLTILAGDGRGGLSALFAEAAADGRWPRSPTPVIEPELPSDIDRFLELPEDLDPGIRRLAQDETAGLRTAYERGLALEAYLRGPGFTYSTDIPAADRNSDLATWLLDEDSGGYHVGYCEQFSASMAVMARSLGIPSRVLLGFTPGDVATDGTIIVRDRNSHAWVELWIPTQGWVRFDPTPRGDGVNPSAIDGLGFDADPYLEAITARARQDRDGVQTPQFGGVDEGDELFGGFAGAGSATNDGAGGGVPVWLIWAALAALAAVGLGLLIPALKAVRRRRRMRRLAHGDITAAWSEIVDRLTDSGQVPDPALTPAELATETDPAMAPLARAYAEQLYASGPLGAEAAADAGSALRATERRLRARQTLSGRLATAYRVRSLLPRSWRRRRRRR